MVQNPKAAKPQHHIISYLLINNTEGREKLREFYKEIPRERCAGGMW